MPPALDFVKNDPGEAPGDDFFTSGARRGSIKKKTIPGWRKLKKNWGQVFTFTGSPIRRGTIKDHFAHGNFHGHSLLTAVVRGDVDLNQIAINHLAGRSLDENGTWIGCDTAKERFIESSCR